MVEQEIGHICGRFHPFHGKHLEYVQIAAEDVDELIIGITNADPSHITPEEEDESRHEPKNNPFRYHERQAMIRNTLDYDDTIDTPATIMPFPINRPELWDHYAPQDTVHYIGIVEPWHHEKADRLEREGRTVERVPMDRDLNGNYVSGTKIRDNMANGNEWQHLVPTPVAQYIEENDLAYRVQELY